VAWLARAVLRTGRVQRRPAVVDRGAQLLVDSLRVTHEAGGTILTGALYSALGKYGAPLSTPGGPTWLRLLAELAAEAKASHDAGLEICNRYETTW